MPSKLLETIEGTQKIHPRYAVPGWLFKKELFAPLVRIFIFERSYHPFISPPFLLVSSC